MKRAVLVLGVWSLAACPPMSVEAAEEVARPNTKLSQPLHRWPNEDDIKRLESVKGLSASKVLEVLGHPSRIEPIKGGHERWIYPWRAHASVTIEHNIATGTFYTAGY